MAHTILFDFLLILLVGVPVVLVMRRFGGSALVAYIFAGGVAGSFSLVNSTDLATFAEIGACLLLFSLGLELDLPQMRKHLRRVLIVACAQLGLTILFGMVLLRFLVDDMPSAFAIACCLALSSTLMVLRALDEQHLRNKQEGQTVLGLLLAQDFSLAPLVLLVTLFLPMQSDAGHTASPWAMVLGMALLLLGTYVFRSALANRLIARVHAAQLPEIEVALSVCIALGTAYFTEHAGLGAAVGAFCAGLALGGDEHRHVIETSTRPLQGLMAIIFFTSIGMQFDIGYVWDHALMVVVALFVSVLIKAMIAGFAFRVTGMATRSAIGCGLMVGQIGEFSFVLAQTAYSSGSLGDDIYKLIVAVACLSLLLTPVMIHVSVHFLPKSSIESIPKEGRTILVAGLGPVGNTVVQVLQERGEDLFLVDRNQRLLAPWHSTPQVTCHFGRIEDMEDWMPVLGRRPIAVILTFPIADTSALVAERLLADDPELLIIARSPYQSQVGQLINAGVKEVICDETATAEGLLPVLTKYLDDSETVIGRRTSLF